MNLVFPGGQVAGTGVFRDIGKFAATNDEFFAAFNGGKPLYLPGSEVPGVTRGVRAQIGGGEGHVEVALSPAFINASAQPNPWGIVPEDAAQSVIDYNMQVFMAIYGREGINTMLDKYGQGHDARTAPKPPAPDPRDATIQDLRAKLADAMKARETAEKNELVVRARVDFLLSELDARAKGMKTAAGTTVRGQYQQALLKAGIALEKAVAEFREKAGA